MEKQNLLDTIQSPRDLDDLTLPQLDQLAQEIREFLVESISKTGGHLASNLGVVELTLAIHRVFHSPQDKILWDVGHQCYTHKILTGRKSDFATLRQEGGLSGFPKPEESPHDAFIAGHSSNSISAGYGIAKALSLRGSERHVVSVIGDGSFTGGMVYEAFNNAGRNKDNLIVILNHNDMSISKNVGAFAKYLSTMRSKQSYLSFKKGLESLLNHFPFFGKLILKGLTKSKSLVKRWIYNTTFFEEMGFEYLGPVDGHNLKELLPALTTAKNIGGPVVVHVDTRKGKGYSFAEENPGAYHGVPCFDVETGNPDIALQDSYSTVFGKELARLAQNDPKICAITAAMKYGTGLQYFKEKFRERFFDVGIAEQHAVTFAAGLASERFEPVFAVYSSFLQRGYDQIIHDCAIESTHVVFAIDRAGIVGDDGETHQGVFDTVFLGSIPNITVYAPESYQELRLCLSQAIYRTEGVAALRYPRGAEKITHNLVCKEYRDYLYDGVVGAKKIVITFGRITENASAAVRHLREQGEKISLLKIIRIIPLPEKILEIASRYDTVFFFEEGMKQGGIAQNFLSALYERGYQGKVKITALPKEFIKQGTIPSVLSRYGLDQASMEQTISS
jgi:1-deoxy-D-xylulose-5-phosphate synthase